MNGGCETSYAVEMASAPDDGRRQSRRHRDRGRAVNNGEVTLSGTVHSRAEKRDAEDVAEHISGVCEINNNLRVARWEDARGTSKEQRH